MTTDHTTADQPDEPGLDGNKKDAGAPSSQIFGSANSGTSPSHSIQDILNDIRVNYGDNGISDEYEEELKAALLRWHTAEVRAVLSSVKQQMDGMIDDLDTDNYFLSVIDAELRKLEKEEL